MMSYAKYLLVKTFSAILIFALLLPFAVKLQHIFEDHEHSVCSSKIESHIHQLNDDCDFLNYNINSFNYSNNFVYEVVEIPTFLEKNHTYNVAFIASHKATFFLRGPPRLT
jgi:hypothetical protein